MIDWDKQLFANPTEKGKRKGARPFRVSVNAGPGGYHREPGRTPVRFHVNLFTNTATPGTWYFNDEGLAIGGQTPDGYDAHYTLSNERGY